MLREGGWVPGALFPSLPLTCCVALTKYLTNSVYTYIINVCNSIYPLLSGPCKAAVRRPGACKAWIKAAVKILIVNYLLLLYDLREHSSNPGILASYTVMCALLSENL